ncbi:MAG: class I SAM-dependent methyltransferase [Candidatus Heimdallarchaeaceae archaeon]
MNSHKFNQIASVYDETRPVPVELLLFFRNEVTNYLKTNCGEKKRYSLLSIGIGTGRAELSLWSKNVELYGIDINKEMLKVAKERNRTVYTCVANALEIPFIHSFDLVSMIHTIQFVKPITKFYTQLKAVSKHVCIGDLYTSLYDNVIVSYYINELEKNNCFTSCNSIDNIEEKLEKWGAQLIKNKEISAKLRLEKIYTIIKDQVLSRFWSVPYKVHKKAINSLDYFIKKEKIDLKEEITTSARAVLRFIYFN